MVEITKNPIEAAVAPLKSDAIERAEQEAKAIVEKVRKELEASGNDLNLVAPYPKSIGPNALFGDRYHIAIAKRKLYGSLVEHRKCSHRPNEPVFVDICQKRVETFIMHAKEDAAFQYDKFVAKLVSKIGEVKDATLSGNHVWGHSILKVTLPDGTVQNWKTQQIVNCSKLGTLFNQWPSRKVK